MPLELTETILLSVEGFDVTIGCSALSPSSALTSGPLPSAPSGVARERDDRRGGRDSRRPNPPRGGGGGRPGFTPIVDFRAPRFIRDRRFRNRLDIRGLVQRILRNALNNGNRPRRPPSPPPPTSPPPPLGHTGTCAIKHTDDRKHNYQKRRVTGRQAGRTHAHDGNA